MVLTVVMLNSREGRSDACDEENSSFVSFMSHSVEHLVELQ